MKPDFETDDGVKQMEKKSCASCKRNLSERVCASCDMRTHSQWQRDPHKWLSILPEEPGWYWLKEDDRETHEIQIVEVVIKHHHVYRCGTECYDQLKEVHGEWQGPIRPE